jgi:hypothetical protein
VTGKARSLDLQPFHPEPQRDDPRIHELLLELVRETALADLA